MKKFTILLSIMLLYTALGYAQVAINKDGSQPNTSSILHVKGDATSKNILLNPGAGGGVGIGTDNPNYKLTIQSENNNALRIIGTQGAFFYGGILSFGDGHLAEIREEGDDSLTIYSAGRTSIMGGNFGIGTGTPEASAKMDVQSTTQGVLLPRMTHAQMKTIVNPATGLIVYQTDNEAGLHYYDGSEWIALATTSYSGSIYRWATFSTYNQRYGWYAGNSSALFGGITPSNWSDNGAIAADLSSDKQILLALFSNKGYAGKNAMIFADEWYSYSSTNGKFAAALFRIENKTSNAINWVVDWYCTSYHSWGEKASITVNGADTWNSGTSDYGANHHETITLSIPANRKSTIIFISGSTQNNNTRGVFLGFDNNCLELPAGLKFIDDLDTAPNGWDY